MLEPEKIVLQMLGELDLVDIWRDHNPNILETKTPP